MGPNEKVRSRFAVGISGSAGDGERDVDSGNVDKIPSGCGVELALFALAMRVFCFELERAQPSGPSLNGMAQ